MDFTFDRYVALMDTLHASRVRTSTLGAYIQSKPSGHFAIIRHDVDIDPTNVVAMAEEERKRGIFASYYFLFSEKPAYHRSWHAIAQMGHEVGYHYAVLSRNGGDIKRGLAAFERELGIMREASGYQIVTCTMHGDPLSPHDNRKIWEHTSLEKFGLIGEGYRSVDFSQLYYFSDTGRTWAPGVRNVYDFGLNHPADTPRLLSTDELAEFAVKSRLPVYILVHPERWQKFGSYMYWRMLARDMAAGVAKNIIMAVRKK